MSSSEDDSSSSSSDEAPVNERPSSHSGLSDEEPSSPQPKTPEMKKSPTPGSKSSSSATPSDDDNVKDEEPIKPKTKEKSKSKSKSKSSSSSSESETEPPPPAPSKPTDTIGSVSPNSSIDAEDKASPSPDPSPDEASNIVPDLSDSDDEGPKRKKVTSPKATAEDDNDSDEDIVGPRLHFEPEDMDEPEPEQPPIEYDVPLIHGDYGKEAPIPTRWPNFISVDQRPFNEETYDPADAVGASVDAEGRSSLQIKVENCIRWRNKLDKDGNVMRDENGKEIKESNAKIVRWSDGSMTLNLGTEVYEINEHKIEEYNQLFLRMRAGLHGNAVFKKRYTFRPATTDSLTHRKMTMQMAQKTNKSQRVKMIGDVGLDPESSRASLIRKEEERLRANMRREAQQRKAKERQYRTGLSHNFLEDRDDIDDDPESLSAIKRSYKNNRFDRFDEITRRYAHSDEEDEEVDSRRIERSKIESDDEEDIARKKEEKKKRKIVISDEDED